MSGRAMAVVGVLTASMVLFGVAGAIALFVSRKRLSKRALVQVSATLVIVESLVIAIGLAAVNAARGGSDTLTAGLLWYAGIGWIVVQVVIVVWWYIGWLRSRR